jgi:hypothetical protein
MLLVPNIGNPVAKPVGGSSKRLYRVTRMTWRLS